MDQPRARFLTTWSQRTHRPRPERVFFFKLQLSDDCRYQVYVDLSAPLVPVVFDQSRPTLQGTVHIKAKKSSLLPSKRFHRNKLAQSDRGSQSSTIYVSLLA